MTYLNWTHKRIILVLFWLPLLFPTLGSAANLLTSRTSSYYAYIYRLNDEEADYLYTTKNPKIKPAFFHSLVDSFPLDEDWNKVLPTGHYLQTFVLKNEQCFGITTVHNVEVFVFNNHTDLCIQVSDLEGNLIRDAVLKVGRKPIRFDETLQAYVDKKSNKKGIVTVSYDGFTTYFDLSRQYNNSAFKRGSTKVLTQTPVKYVWMPINYVVRLPIDGVKSIDRHYAYGTIYRTKQFFVRSYHKVACLFDPYSCDYSNPLQRKYTGYMVFSQPKYLPEDTVKFKSYLVTKKGKPLKKPVRVVLTGSRKEVKLSTLESYHEGGFSSAFALHDSLQLTLDRYYSVELQNKKGHAYLRESFKYEDYELKENNLEIRVDKTEQFSGQDVHLFVKGTDINELNLLNARLQIELRTQNTLKVFDELTFVPHVLDEKERNLAPVGETEVIISDSIFPKANFSYTLSVRMLTAENETLSKKENITYFYKDERFEHALKEDSIAVSFLKNGQEAEVPANVFGVDNFGNKTLVATDVTPFSFPFSTFYAQYTLTSDSIQTTFNLAEESSGIQCFSERTQDSVFVSIHNPRKLPFIYHIYKRNQQKKAGYSDSLQYRVQEKSGHTYMVSIRYLWGGIVKTDNYGIPLVKDRLRIQVDAPKLVYPGQKTRIEVSVTDFKKQPVEGVDLTAYSLTGKFGYDAPTLPSLGKKGKGKQIVNNFTIEDKKLQIPSGLELDYTAWKILAGLDTIEYYKFIYPSDSVYRYTYETSDKATQLAPFVVVNGEVQPVHVIYVDRVPQYFSWNSVPAPYTVRVSPGKHQVRLRTANHEITLKRLTIPEGKKLIISLDADSINDPWIIVHPMAPQLGNLEQQALYRYILPYRNTFGRNTYSYLQHKDTYQLLSTHNTTAGNPLWSGPTVGKQEFKLYEGFSTSFWHEPFFEYEFSERLLKMRSIDKWRMPAKLSVYEPPQPFNDTLLTPAILEKQWQEHINDLRRQTPIHEPHQTHTKSNGILRTQWASEETAGGAPLNVLLFKHDDPDFIHTYAGNTTYFHFLEEGFYRLMYFYPGAQYFTVDSIPVREGGNTYYKITVPEKLKKDTFSMEVASLLEKRLMGTLKKDGKFYPTPQQINTLYRQTQTFSGEGYTVSGTVYEKGTNTPIMGVNILVEGTFYGTVTDMNGKYTLKIPTDFHLLNFSFIGFESAQINLLKENADQVYLKESALFLNEVVSSGSSVLRKDVSTSVSYVVDEQFAAMGDVMVVDALQGKLAGLAIEIDKSGRQSNAGIVKGADTQSLPENALIVINGVVYAGSLQDINPDIIKELKIIKGEEATQLYGQKASNGVVLITVNPDDFDPALLAANKGATYDADFLEAASQVNQMRENFSDAAFWQPRLITNSEGKASFEVTFPDDITRWDTYVLGMNGKRQSGQTQGSIQSYKPLMAQLYQPRFLLEGDFTQLIGKVRNYMPDSAIVKTAFSVDGTHAWNDLKHCRHSFVDTFSLRAGSDSMEISYTVTTNDGYLDGEKRTLPVFPVGLEQTRGTFDVLNGDTSFVMDFSSFPGTTTVYARADVLDVFRDEIQHVMRYSYYCNEQLASKLKALLMEKHIQQYTGQRFKNDKEIEKLISRLMKNKTNNQLWGWWKGSTENYWISLHVAEALALAQKEGYRVKDWNTEVVKDEMLYLLNHGQNFKEHARALKLLKLLGSEANFQNLITDLAPTSSSSLDSMLTYTELLQLYRMPWTLDFLKPHRNTTLFGNVYFSDKQAKTFRQITQTNVMQTVRAYRLLRNDSTTSASELTKIRNYLLEERKDGNWINTYESAQVMETILPDLLQGDSHATPPGLMLVGADTVQVAKFPFQTDLENVQKLHVTKTGDFPVYFTAYQKYWNPKPEAKSNDFRVESFLSTGKNPLKGGEKVTLNVRVQVNKDAEYVMLTVPIPAGCTYEEKIRGYYPEVHREYFKHQTAIFCETLPAGVHTFSIPLLARYGGEYTLNPAKIELMYFPTFNANNAIKKIEVK